MNLSRFLRKLGPGLVTGASDDDPGGIATYAIAGASLGLSTLWTALFTLPLMTAVQLTCARIGLVSGTGLTRALRKRYPRLLIAVVCLALLAANVLNIGADLTGMADAASMLTGWPPPLFVAIFAAVTIVFTVKVKYATFARYIKWSTIVLFGYVGAAFVTDPQWSRVLAATFVPEWRADEAYLTTLLALLGTTISPYLFFWQASHEVEAEKEKGRESVAERRGSSDKALREARADVFTGMAFSNIIFYFIVLTTASTLYREGVREIETTRQAAEALRPIAGEAAYLLFGIGLIGSGLLAIPVLAGSASFAIAELFGWKSGLDLRWYQATRFYVVLAGAVTVGTLLYLTGVNAVRMLFFSSLINGILAPPVLALILLAANDARIMGGKTNGFWLNLLGWLTVGLMGTAALVYLF